MPRDLDMVVSNDSAHAFASDLARLGIQCAVEVQDGVALVRPIDELSGDRFADHSLRGAVLERGRVHGFMRVALIIEDR